MDPFFHRIEGLDLINGNKTAGFVLHIETQTLQKLRNIPVSLEDNQNLLVRMRERVIRAKLLPKKAVSECGVALVAETACPLMFTTDPIFGGSLGGVPEDLARLGEPHGLDYLGSTMTYTSHNVDLVAQALVLLILIETWAEWAHDKLVLLEHAERDMPPLIAHEAGSGDLMTLAEYEDACESGELTSDDGDGYYATAEGYSYIRVGAEQPKWATHVVWHNR